MGAPLSSFAKQELTKVWYLILEAFGVSKPAAM
jgi:hypothetical protein